MTGNHSHLGGSTVYPELMAAFAGSQILKSSAPQAPDNVPIFQSRHPAHAGSGSETGSEKLKVLALRLNRRRNAGGSDSPSERYTSMRIRALACANSMAS